MKCVTDVVESSASVDVDPERVRIVLPEVFTMPDGGLNIRWPDPPLIQEAHVTGYGSRQGQPTATMRRRSANACVGRCHRSHVDDAAHGGRGRQDVHSLCCAEQEWPDRHALPANHLQQVVRDVGRLDVRHNQ